MMLTVGFFNSHNVVVETEKKFSIKFLSSEIISWENVGKMIDCIEEKLKK